ncbi:unnamed protein product [Schistosoma guineensis]|nr:unnamed protein product [Schistosoma guineensis]
MKIMSSYSFSIDIFFQISAHGFPHQPTCIAFDPVQRIVAVGTKCGFIRIFGRPGVDCSISHPSASAVLQIFFLVNEGGLVSICGDDVAHLWNIRQKNPEIVHSLQFKREHAIPYTARISALDFITIQSPFLTWLNLNEQAFQPV